LRCSEPHDWQMYKDLAAILTYFVTPAAAGVHGYPIKLGMTVFLWLQSFMT